MQEILSTSNVLIFCVSLVCFVTCIMAFLIFKESWKLHKFLAHQEYRQRAMKGLIFEDLWRPDESYVKDGFGFIVGRDYSKLPDSEPLLIEYEEGLN